MIKRLKELLKKHYIWLIFGIVMIILIEIIEDVFESEIMQCDIIAYNAVINFRIDWITNIFKTITLLGGAAVLVTITMAIIIIVKEKKIGMIVIGNLAGVGILNVLLKHIIQRQRPEGVRLIAESGYSFPSGHSMVSTAFYGLIIYFILRNVKNKYIRNISCILLGILIIAICTSRVYLGVHYASDVIAGFCISITYLIIIIKILDKILYKKNT